MLTCITKKGHSDCLPKLCWIDLPRDAKFVFSIDTTEERISPQAWKDAMASSPELCIAITQSKGVSISVSHSGSEYEVGLTDADKISELFGPGLVYIDVSGLSHSVWAPLLKIAMSSCSGVRLIYSEPLKYKIHSSPTSASLFDLSVEFRGIHPLPGFANLMGPADEASAIFVPFLGFEGPRSRQVAMSLDPIPKVVPVVGLPGFKLEYPQVTLACNQEFLRENSAEHRVRFARANCPFEAYSVLTDIRRDNPKSYIYVAPIGTKPHAIGAILFAIDNPTDTEIMFDHPIKSAGRTSGIGAVHVYHVKG